MPLRHGRRSWIWLVCRPRGARMPIAGPGSDAGWQAKGEIMDETQDQAGAPSASPGEHDGHRRPVRGKMGELEGGQATG